MEGETKVEEMGIDKGKGGSCGGDKQREGERRQNVKKISEETKILYMEKKEVSI